MKRKKLILFNILAISILTILFSQPVSALDVPEIKNRVTDLVGVLKPDELQYLENTLKNTEDQTSSQVVVLIIESLQGESLEEFSLKVAQTAKLGQKEFNNGLLVLVALAEKKVRIEVGYGLEPIMTDAKCGYIIRNMIVPQFEKGKYFAGLHDGLQAITGVITKQSDITPEQLEKFRKDQKKTKGPHVSVGGIIFFIILLLGFFKNAGRGGGMRGATSALFLGSMISGSSHRSGGSGFGGGGFSGGGGSFGGGGSSGSW
jgi:uncharacterized protein